MPDVNLTVSHDIVDSVVSAKIQAAIVEAMRGHEAIIDRMIETVLQTSVDGTGKVNRYSSENKHNFLEVLCRDVIQQAVKDAVIEYVASHKDTIKKQVAAALKRNPSKIVQGLLSGAGEALAHQHRFHVELRFHEPR